MTTAQRKALRKLLNALRVAEAWNRADLEGFEDISPDEPMLEARRDVLRTAVKEARKLLEGA